MSKLWLISQNENEGYDTYSDAVVCADTEDEAQHIHPSEYYRFHDGKLWFQYDDGTEKSVDQVAGSWTTPDKVTAELIGTAVEDIEVGRVVCASYHAG